MRTISLLFIGALTIAGCDPIAYAPLNPFGELIVGEASCARRDREDCARIIDRTFVNADFNATSYYAADGWHYYSAGTSVSRDRWFISDGQVLTHGAIIGRPRDIGALIRDSLVVSGDATRLRRMFEGNPRSYGGLVATLGAPDVAAFSAAIERLEGSSK